MNPVDAPADPRSEYEERRAARRLAEGRLRRRDLWIANLRLAVFLIGVGLTWPVFLSPGISAWWLAPPIAAFLALVAIHDRVLRRRRRAASAVAFYERGLARLSDAWIGTGETGERFLDRSHLYAEDLDLFGRGSLFELLCTARTAAGEETLAAWLLRAAPPAEILARQGAVEELSRKLDLREELAVLAGEARGGLRREVIERWAEGSGFAARRAVLVPAVALAIAGGLAAAAWILALTGPLPVIAAFVLSLLLAIGLHQRLKRAVEGLDKPGEAFRLLSGILARIEAERFQAERLRAVQGSLREGGADPSRRIARLARLIEMQEWSKNAFFAPIAILLNWNVLLASAIDAWRARHGTEAVRWLGILGEIEALCALASHLHEHPADTFPEIREGGALFEAEALGHPLIPEGACVRNDVRLDRGTRLLVVSGSNMSGKSTLLRAVGANTVLALAGGSARARRLALSHLALGASIRTQDSLLEGKSRFYAEILRLHQLMERAAGSPPLLFLIDEVLQGTNSHDRRIGSEAILRGLAERGALGLVTTHDLALTEIPDRLGAPGANVHFEDHIENGKIAFDYRLRPGIVARSNAIALMRAVGLDV